MIESTLSQPAPREEPAARPVHVAIADRRLLGDVEAHWREQVQFLPRARHGSITTQEANAFVPVRFGVGWRQGASVGYLHFTPKMSLIPI